MSTPTITTTEPRRAAPRALLYGPVVSTEPRRAAVEHDPDRLHGPGDPRHVALAARRETLR